MVIDFPDTTPDSNETNPSNGSSSETRRAGVITDTDLTPVKSAQSWTSPWRSPQGKQPIYLTHHWDRRWTIKVHSNKSIVLTLPLPLPLPIPLGLHALLPQVRKECRVITRFITNWSVCKNIDKLWVTFQYKVHWVTNVRLDIHYSSLKFCQVNLTLIVKLDHQDQGSYLFTSHH